MYNSAPDGEVAEWSNVPDSKSGVLQGTVGSNPTLSAKCHDTAPLLGRFVFLPIIKPIKQKVLGWYIVAHEHILFFNMCVLTHQPERRHSAFAPQVKFLV